MVFTAKWKRAANAAAATVRDRWAEEIKMRFEFRGSEAEKSYSVIYLKH